MKKQLAIILLSAWLLNGANAILGCGGCCCTKIYKAPIQSSFQENIKLCGMKLCGSSVLEKKTEPSILCSFDFQKVKYFGVSLDFSSTEAMVSFDFTPAVLSIQKIPIENTPIYLQISHFLI